MTPQDFRVGHIFHRKHGKGWTETEITPEIMGKIFSDKDPEYAINDFEPIELSEEWLKKAGFVGLEYWTDLKTGWFTLDSRDGYYRLSYTHCNIGEQFKYVHQLQNLYYALTGNELIFNHG